METRPDRSIARMGIRQRDADLAKGGRLYNLKMKSANKPTSQRRTQTLSRA